MSAKLTEETATTARPLKKTVFRCQECSQFLAVAVWTQQPAVYAFCSYHGCNTWYPREPRADLGYEVRCGVTKTYDRAYLAAGMHQGCGNLLGRVHFKPDMTVGFRCADCGCPTVHEQRGVEGPEGHTYRTFERGSDVLQIISAMVDTDGRTREN